MASNNSISGVIKLKLNVNLLTILISLVFSPIALGGGVDGEIEGEITAAISRYLEHQADERRRHIMVDEQKARSQETMRSVQETNTQANHLIAGLHVSAVVDLHTDQMVSFAALGDANPDARKLEGA